MGSSPRGRGKPPGPDLTPTALRLIPAWAGKTLQGHEAGWDFGAHPRVGGENAAEETAVDIHLGSSPRGRGKPNRSENPRNRARLIPAWAGKTRRTARWTGGSRAHPRVGGENMARDT